MTRPVYIWAAKRSIIAPQGGALAGLCLHDLAAPVVQDALSAADIGPEDVDEVIAANALGAGGNPARLIALAAGLPRHVAGLTLDRQCAGGLDALLLAQAMIASGQADCVVAGGVESHSPRPFRAWQRDGALIPYTQPPFAPDPKDDPDMAQAADLVAREGGITRAMQDAFAVQSHAKARAAQADLQAEITQHPALPPDQSDSFTRNLRPQTCARAKVISGDITHANSAVAADGAAFLVVSSERPPHGGALLLGGTTVGSDPARPAMAPVAAVQKAQSRLGIPSGSIAQVELMEAYAAQALANIQALELDHARINPKGGALARGHPIGASGAVLAVRLFNDLCGTDETGLAAIAAAGGLGCAAIVQGLGPIRS